MAKKARRRPRHIPQRTCVGCREVLPKRNLIRIVRGPDGVNVDLTGKAHGRGAYLHDRQLCWERGIKHGIEHALKTKLTDQERNILMQFIKEQVPEEEIAQQGAEGLSG